MKRLIIAGAVALSAAAVAVPAVIMSAAPAGASSAAAGTQFAADRATMGAASDVFDQAFQAWEKSGAPTSQTSSFVSVYVAAIVAEDHKLLDQSWPAGTMADIDAVVQNDAAVEGAVSALPSQTSASLSGWFTSFDQGAATAVADANIVRRDLGLPLASTS